MCGVRYSISTSFPADKCFVFRVAGPAIKDSRRLMIIQDDNFFFRYDHSFLACSGVPPDHLLLDSALNLGPLISPWKIKKFKNFWHKCVRILEVLKLLFLQFLNLSSSQRDMGGPILGALSNNRWSGGSIRSATKWSKNMRLRGTLSVL